MNTGDEPQPITDETVRAALNAFFLRPNRWTPGEMEGMHRALEAVAATFRTEGAVEALRDLSGDLKASGLGDDIGDEGVGMAGFVWARADRVERGEPRG